MEELRVEELIWSGSATLSSKYKKVEVVTAKAASMAKCIISELDALGARPCELVEESWWS